MGRVSIPTIGLFALGILLVILAGFNNGTVPPIGFWGLYGQYILLIVGATLIVVAVVLMRGNR